MAEIHVQTKRHTTSSPTWIWIVIALLVVAVVTWFVMRNKETAPAQTPPPANPTSQVHNATVFNNQYELA